MAEKRARRRRPRRFLRMDENASFDKRDALIDDWFAARSIDEK